ncbi:hypothetical protein [Persicitalea jodogahamensis]|uniref:Uncharacterized protein n=1 Tax=Persicitalea jodogahamensis TaxID=402147 RepID=A0A8J3D374_9BACT|nr:hypothetical protein [Persicitalea jodogahamensis]GHB64083.1 hypothetical protein GCM10007390_17450 [Persicitalea jodogahamensis]
MNCRLIKLSKLSGDKASIYSVILGDEQETLFDKFLKENATDFKEEVQDIVKRLRSIAKNHGAREQYFKVNEGSPGDGVCALYDDPDSNLRLYCIRYGQELIILGNGGYKPKSIRAFQEDDKLTKENYFLRELSGKITERLKDSDLRYINGYSDFEGDLEFNDDDYE